MREYRPARTALGIRGRVTVGKRSLILVRAAARLFVDGPREFASVRLRALSL